MDQPRIANVEGALEKLEGLVEVSRFSGTPQGPNHGIATLKWGRAIRTEPLLSVRPSYQLTQALLMFEDQSVRPGNAL